MTTIRTARNPYVILEKVLKNILVSQGESSPLSKFYELFYKWDFHPDVNGYTLIFMIPPDFSGFGIGSNSEGSDKRRTALPVYISELAPLLATSFSPPQTQVTTESVSAKFGSIPFGTAVESTGQLNITYIDNQHLHIFAYHKLWQDYMRDVIQGDVEPDLKYMRINSVGIGKNGVDDYIDDYCEIDYMASAYIVRFKVSAGFGIHSSRVAEGFFDNIVYIGKATGIFPITIPDTEVIGRRDSPQMTIVPISYSCASYRRHTPQLGVDDGYSYILTEFRNSLKLN